MRCKGTQNHRNFQNRQVLYLDWHPVSEQLVLEASGEVVNYSLCEVRVNMQMGKGFAS